MIHCDQSTHLVEKRLALNVAYVFAFNNRTEVLSVDSFP